MKTIKQQKLDWDNPSEANKMRQAIVKELQERKKNYVPGSPGFTQIGQLISEQMRPDSGVINKQRLQRAIAIGRKYTAIREVIG